MPPSPATTPPSGPRPNNPTWSRSMEWGRSPFISGNTLVGGHKLAKAIPQKQKPGRKFTQHRS
eukprot:4422689-Lingulodinium_polyedra.AAC.1